MWINRELFERTLAENKRQQLEIQERRELGASMIATMNGLTAQKTKDDLNLDWMRHRVNALEKQNAILISKAAGVHFPVPEIVPVKPGSMTVPDFSSLPSFEDVGDSEAARLGAGHDDSGSLIFRE
jgi:hypothetical protein